MEILTSMTFWIIVVVIIVILAIIGYLAEGTVLANKKQDNKKETENKGQVETAWTNENLAKDDRQEKVYNTAEKSWNEMPDVSATSNDEINKPATLNAEANKSEAIDSFASPFDMPSSPITKEDKAVNTNVSESSNDLTNGQGNLNNTQTTETSKPHDSQKVSETIVPEGNNNQNQEAEKLDAESNKSEAINSLASPFDMPSSPITKEDKTVNTNVSEPSNDLTNGQGNLNNTQTIETSKPHDPQKVSETIVPEEDNNQNQEAEKLDVWTN